jgi:hypothetical protein
MKGCLPTNDGEGNTYRVAYAVHKVLEAMSGPVEGEPQPAEQRKTQQNLSAL